MAETGRIVLKNSRLKLWRSSCEKGGEPSTSSIADIPMVVQIAGMILPWLALAILSTPMQAPADQSADALLLLKFIDAVKRGRDKEAETLLAPEAFIGDYRQLRRTSFGDFANYARGCKLTKLTLVPATNQRMPIGVQWFCRYPEGERSASFWFEGNRISRIGWGKPPVIKVPRPALN